MDISDTLAPKSDQLDAVDLVGGPQTFTVDRVTRGNAEQPVQVHLVEFPRVWRPSKGMRRVLAYCWGKDASTWVGRRVRLYCDPDVMFGPEKVGGTRIAALSHIDGPKSVPTIEKRGKSSTYVVQPLSEDALPPAKDWDAVLATATGITDLDALQELWRREGIGGAPQQIQDAVNARATQLKESPSE